MPYQSRVFTDTIKLTSSFWPTSTNTVNCSVWFQDELPFPGVDLNKLKPRNSDQYPPSIIHYIEKDHFVNYYQEIIRLNFDETIFGEYDHRFFFNYDMMDQYTHRHMLPFFLSKIVNKDQTILQFDEDGEPIRGLRTFGELAHFVRCFPYQSREGLLQEDELWCSPDYMLTQKAGSQDDHCLLMASLFRTCKWEDREDFEIFRKEERKKTLLRKDKDRKLLYGDDEEKEGDEAAGENDGEEGAAEAGTDGQGGTATGTADEKTKDEKGKDD